jgi:hypothetical protein
MSQVVSSSQVAVRAADEERGMRLILSVGCILACAGSALAQPTNNILITGYWPPTNEMLRPWSQSPAQNPGGWQGENWEGRGYDIHSYFPEFPGITSPPYGQGQGDFRVDYQHASEDFWRVVGELRPIAIITFSRGSTGPNWEIEARHRKLPLNSWTPDYEAPTRPTTDLPIASEPDNFIRNSSLPMQAIMNAVNAASLGFGAFIDTSSSFGGTFVSEFTGYHSSWYANMHSDPNDPSWCIAGGHIHVGGNTPVSGSLAATQITLRTLTGYLDTVIPSPWAAPALGCGLLLTRPRRRTER